MKLKTIITMLLASFIPAMAAGMASKAVAVAPAADESIPEGMCKLVLEAHDVFENGTNGFQWILDADHDTYGQVFFDGSFQFFGNYSRFEYTLPENAEANGTTSTVLVDGECSIFVPAGVYDWMVICPSAEGLGFPYYAEWSKVDDFEFKAGEVYRLFADYIDGDNGPGEALTMKVARDVALAKLSLPATGMNLGFETIGVQVTNAGSEAMDNIELSYSLNGAPAVTEKLAGGLGAGESKDFVFATKADFSAPGTYTVAVTVNAEGDMLATNNSVGGTCRNLEAQQLPYDCNFSALGTAGFESDWIVIDANQDGSTWMFSEWMANKDGVNGVASCSGNCMGDRIGNDWLISLPLNMGAGDHTLSFSTKGIYDTTKEIIEVCIGKTPTPEAMTVLATFEVMTTDWAEKGVNVPIEAAGAYYVAFHVVSEAGMNAMIGDVSVKEGSYQPKATAKIEKLYVPYSNCSLSASARLGMKVTNTGDAPLADYTLKCVVNATEAAASSFSTPIQPGETVDVYLDKGIDLSKVGVYDIELTLSWADMKETVLAIVECFEPLDELPLASNFILQDNVYMWRALTAEAWVYDAMFSAFHSEGNFSGIEHGLMCRGIHFEHDARMKLSYAGTGWGVAAFAVYFGKAGADLSEYTKVYEDPQLTSEIKEAEFMAPVAAPGNYSFILAIEKEDGSRSNVQLGEATISEIKPFDMRAVAVTAPVSAYLPASQTGLSATCLFEVENRGSKAMTGVKGTLTIDGKATAVSESAITVAAGEKAVMPIVVALPKKKVGEQFTLAFEVAGAEKDEYTADNIYTLPTINVTESQRSVENIADLEYGTGASMETIAIGNVYGLADVADLTSATVGLCLAEASVENALGEIAFNIYSLKADGTLDRCIYSEKRVRGVGGFIEFDFADMRLNPGYYYFEVEQLSTFNMGLAYNLDSEAVCYQRVGNALNRLAGIGYALCIRAQFAPGAKVYAKDACAVSIDSPDAVPQLFGPDEKVTATVRNAGYEQASFTATLALDGRQLVSRQFSLLPYENAVIEMENVDLSAAGAHALECSVALQGDENTANDKIVSTITTEEEANPYVMDFEHCRDFDAAGSRWNPRWTTIDRNNVATDLFWRYNHPHRGEPCGFMAFNPAATTPSAIEVPHKNLLPHAGDRFGLAFVYNAYAEGAENLTHADVWLVSPKLKLGDGSSFNFYVRTRDLESRDHTLEPYRVLVSTTDNAPESFSVLGADERLAPVEDWEAVTVDLSAFDGKDVYVAVQYIGRPIYNTCLMIDDLEVKTTLDGLQQVAVGAAPTIAYDADASVITVSGGRVLSFEVFTLAGQPVALCSPMADGPWSKDLGGMCPGVYVARATTAQGVATLKFIVK